MNRIKDYIIHLLGGKTEDEYRQLQNDFYRMKTDRFNDGVCSIVATLFTLAYNVSNRSDKEWRNVVGSYIGERYDEITKYNIRQDKK
jgi:hypothetical protein